MKLHPRHGLVAAASIDIQTAITEAVARHDLTHAELTNILAQVILLWNKYAIREEREEPEDSSLERMREECREKVESMQRVYEEAMHREYGPVIEVLHQKGDLGAPMERLCVIDIQRAPGITKVYVR